MSGGEERSDEQKVVRYSGGTAQSSAQPSLAPLSASPPQSWRYPSPRKMMHPEKGGKRRTTSLHRGRKSQGRR